MITHPYTLGEIKQKIASGDYMCWDCCHKGPAVDCTGRTSEDCRSDRALNAEMKRLWNSQEGGVA